MICLQMLQIVYYTYMSGVKYCDYGVIFGQKPGVNRYLYTKGALIYTMFTKAQGQRLLEPHT